MQFNRIPLDTVHSHWKRLTFVTTHSEDPGIPNDDLNLKIEFEAIQRRFDAADHAGRTMIKQKARELAFPDTTSMNAPPEPVPTKGAPKKGKGKKKGKKKSEEFSTKREPSQWEHVDKVFDSQQGSNSAAAQSRKRATPPVSKSSTPGPSGSSNPGTFPPPKSRAPRTKMAKVGYPTPPLANTVDPTPSQVDKPTQSNSSNIAVTVLQGLSLNPPPPIIRSKDYIDYITHMPKEMHRFVEDIVNVKGDGHCGFRCLAALLGRGEDGFQSVRTELFEELQSNVDLYSKLFNGMGNVYYVMKALMCQHRNGKENWMSVPECSYLAVNKYNVVVVNWYRVMPFSCFPFNIPPIKGVKVFNILCTDDHFVILKMKKGHPMPGVNIKWTEFKKPVATRWPLQYGAQLQQFSVLMPAQGGGCVDLTKD